MGLIVKKPEKTAIPPLTGGTYAAVCIGIVDLGEQYNERFKKVQNVVSLTFEIAGETVERGSGPEPRWLSREYTKISKRMKGIDPGKPISETFVFDMDDEDRDKRIQDLSPWVRKKIELSPTWARLHAGSEEMDLDEDEGDAPGRGDAPTEGDAPVPQNAEGEGPKPLPR